MAKLQLNVAGRPFVNQRPLVIGTVTATLVLAAVTFFNVYGVVGIMAGLRSERAHISANKAETELARSVTEDSQAELGAAEARRIRRVAGTVSGIIQKRRLSWSLLLDHLAAVMPSDARVLSVVPDAKGSRIHLLLSAVAKSNEAKLQFFTRLNEAPFSDAHIMGETIDGKQYRFTINCRYDPEAAERLAQKARREASESAAATVTGESAIPAQALGGSRR